MRRRQKPRNRQPLLKRIFGSSSSFLVASLVFHGLLFIGASIWGVRSLQAKRGLHFKGAPTPSAAPRQRQLEYKVQNVKPHQMRAQPPGLTRVTTNASSALVSVPASPVSGPALGGALGAMSKMGALSGASFAAPGAGGAMKGFPAGALTAFGFRGPGGKGLRGTYYDLMRDSNGRDLPMSSEDYLRAIEAMFGPEGKMRPLEAAKYYRSKAAVTGCFFCFAPLDSGAAPVAFGEKAHESRAAWIVRYVGRIASERQRRIRFVGGFDEVLLVLINQKLVLDGTWKTIPWKNEECPTNFKASGTIEPIWSDIRRVGDWFEIGPSGVEIEIIIGEGWGGIFSGALCVEEEGVSYEENRRPVFKLDGFQSMPAEQRAVFENEKDHLEFRGPTFRAL